MLTTPQSLGEYSSPWCWMILPSMRILCLLSLKSYEAFIAFSFMLLYKMFLQDVFLRTYKLTIFAIGKMEGYFISDASRVDSYYISAGSSGKQFSLSGDSSVGGYSN